MKKDSTDARQKTESVDDSDKKPFQFRRTKSERTSRNIKKQFIESRIESPTSITRATQIRTRRCVIIYLSNSRSIIVNALMLLNVKLNYQLNRAQFQ